MDGQQHANLTKGIAESKAVIKALESAEGPGAGKPESLDREKGRLAYLEARLVRFGG